MAKQFALLRSRMTTESQARAKAKAQVMLAEMPLNELRLARGLSQKMLAEVLQVQQPSIAKMEKRTEPNGVRVNYLSWIPGCKS